MKKTLLLLVMGLFTLGASAQLNMSSRTGSEVIDKDKNGTYIVALENNSYQIFLQDYFKSREIAVSLGADKQPFRQGPYRGRKRRIQLCESRW